MKLKIAIINQLNININSIFLLEMFPKTKITNGKSFLVWAFSQISIMSDLEKTAGISYLFLL